MKRSHAHLRSRKTRRNRRVRAQSHFRRLQFEPLEARRLLAVFTVDNPFDTPVAGLTSLREAIGAANSTTGADEIQFNPGLFANGSVTIVLRQGELSISDSLTISGPGANLLTIDASGNDPTPQQVNADGSHVFRMSNGNS